MKLYYQNPGESAAFLDDGAEFSLRFNLGNDLGDSVDFSSTLGHIKQGAKITIKDDGGAILWIGYVIAVDYSVAGGRREYECVAAESLIDMIHSPDIAYPGNIDLPMSVMFSSDAPAQSGTFANIMGLLWLSRSKITEGLASWSSSGVGTLSGWGPKVSGHDIYYNGHLCTLGGLSVIEDGDYRASIQGGNLYVRGTGTGDIYGVICADGWTENSIRLGGIDTDSELEGAYVTGRATMWELIRDFVSEDGQYVVWRRGQDGYVYLDIAREPKHRGSATEPVASLHIRDDFSLRQISERQDPKYSCVLGRGAGYETASGVRIGAASPTPIGEAWIEEPYELADARLPPWGHLDQATRDYYDEIDQHAPVKINLYRDGRDVGDWIEMDLGHGDIFTAQIRTLTLNQFGPNRATIGAPDLSILTSLLERSETAAIESYRDRINGEESSSDDLTINLLGDTSFDFRGMCYYDGYIYIIVKNLMKIQKLNSNTLESPALIPIPEEVEEPYGIATDGTHVWITNNELNTNGGGIYKIDMEGTLIQTIAEIHKGGGSYYDIFYPRGIIVLGSYIYFNSGYYLYKLNLSDGSYVSSQSYYKSYPAMAYPYGLCTDGTYIYGSYGYDVRRIDKFNTSLSRLATVELATPPEDGLDHHLTYMNNYLYLADYDGYTYKIIADLSAGASDSDASDARGITSDGTHLFDALNGGLIRKLNGSMSRIDQVRYPGWSGTPWEMTFTTDDFEGEDALVLFSLAASGYCENPSARADYGIYVNMIGVAVIHGVSWGGTVVNELDISEACYVDGSLNVIQVFAKWNYNITETLEHTGTVRGITKQ